MSATRSPTAASRRGGRATPDPDDGRHRGPAIHVRRELHDQLEQHRLRLEPDHRRRVRQRRRPGPAGRQPDLRDDLGRRRHRHLRILELRHDLVVDLRPGGWTTRSGAAFPPRRLAGDTPWRPATSPTRCFTTANPFADRERQRRLRQRHDRGNQAANVLEGQAGNDALDGARATTRSTARSATTA